MIYSTVFFSKAFDLTSFWSDGYRLRGLTEVTGDIQTYITGGITHSITLMISINPKKFEYLHLDMYFVHRRLQTFYIQLLLLLGIKQQKL